MRTAGVLVAALVLGAESGCGLIGFGLGDYGGISDDGGGVDASPDGSGPDAHGGDGSGDVRAMDVPAMDHAGTDSSDGAVEVPPPNDAPNDTFDAGNDVAEEDAGGCTLAFTKHVFVSSSHPAVSQMGGLMGADGICQLLASGAGLSGVYMAWLSSETVSAASRLSHATVPYVLVDNVTIVACDWTELASSTHQHAIDMDETGHIAPTSPGCGAVQSLAVWTGTNPGGVITVNDTCQSWTTGNASGVMGFAQLANIEWTDGCAGGLCGQTGALYCIEQ